MKIEDMNFDLLARLTAVSGISGREWQVAELIRSALPAQYEVQQDALGNLTVHVPGKGKRVMLMAHMDEVGLIVRRVLENGFLRVERLGGINLHALPGSLLTLTTEKGSLDAVVGLLPQHLDNNAEPELNSLYLDIGAGSAREVSEMGVQVGDSLTWSAPLKRIGSKRVCSKALDDRLGCWVLLMLAEQIKPADLSCDLYLTFSVQEETMLKGGLPAVNTFAPEVVIGVDGTLTFDTPELIGEQSEIVIGGGPTVKWMDTIRGKQVTFVPDQDLVRYARQAAEQLHIPLQSEIVVGLSTAVSSIPLMGSGIATLALSLPIRYHHSPVEMADLSDVLHMVQLLKYLITQA